MRDYKEKVKEKFIIVNPFKDKIKEYHDFISRIGGAQKVIPLSRLPALNPFYFKRPEVLAF